MHVVCINYTYHPALTEPPDLLDRYETLTGWADALSEAGLRVSVVQRFGKDTNVVLRGVPYIFVRSPSWRTGGLLDNPRKMHMAVRRLQPDIVHVNGLQFARQAARLKVLLMGDVPILLQDHAGRPPQHSFGRWTLRSALRKIDAVSFVSREQARGWRDSGLLDPSQSIFELMEGSSRFSLQSRCSARARTGLTGKPLCLWVGRLNLNKDPLTVLKGFAKAMDFMPDARLAMVYGVSDLLPEVRSWLDGHRVVKERVMLLGMRPHGDLEEIYNSADLFLSGSHREGSGYAAIEALSCGVVPILTDIPSFRVLTARGAVGGLWPVGNADAMAGVLKACHGSLHSETPLAIRAFFEDNFCWEAIGRKAASTYRQLFVG